MWKLKDDCSEAIIRARDQINIKNGCRLCLPETAIVFFMSVGVDYLCQTQKAKLLPEPFPRFLNRCPVWEIPEMGLCFLDGGRGAPQAADTMETLNVLGVRNVVAVGMCGAFDRKVAPGDIIIPNKAFVEEGTSLHYYEKIDYAQPNEDLLSIASSMQIGKSFPTVSTDAVYRQTFEKERLWREKGAVGVDMECSAVFSVSRYLGMRAVALLMVSDIHPEKPDEPRWAWSMTKELRCHLARQGLALAGRISRQS